MTLDEELAALRKKQAANGAVSVPGVVPAAMGADPAQPEDPAPAPPEPTAKQAAAPVDTPAVVAPTATEPPIDPRYADLPPAETGLTPVPDASAGFWDVAAAGWTATNIASDAWSYNDDRRRALALSMERLLPDEARQRIYDTFSNSASKWTTLEELVVNEAAKIAQQSPDAAQQWAGYPLSIEAFDQSINATAKREWEEAQSVLDQPGGGFAEFLGSGARAITDQTSLALLPFGVSGSAWRMIAGEAALGGIGEAVTLPREYDVAARLDLPEPDALARIATGVAFGGILSGAVHGIAKGISVYRARQLGLRAANPPGGDLLDTTARIEAAEGQLRGQPTVQEALGPRAGDAPEGTLGAVLGNAIPPVSPDAPEGWAQIRNGIFAGESGGDYNALFGYQNRKGGKFSRVKLTSMTVDQAIEFSDPRGAYGQWVKGQIGRVATPMGAYQIVGTTLRAAKKALRLEGDEVMTPELQEQLAHWIYREQGTGAWEGYRGPRDTFSPTDPSRDAPKFTTSRGFTGDSQVSAGDRFRIDVTYEVVDASTLQKATGQFQPRDRSRIASDAWIADTAARLDPALLMPAPTADRGAPIVGPDNMVESGNGRVAAINRVYEQHPDRAEAYRAQIEDAGFTVPEGMQRPVLIARRKTEFANDAERADFTLAGQDSGVAAMTPTEVAQASSRAMTAPVLMQLDPAAPLADAANGGFVRAVLSGLPRSARNAMFDASGMLNATGLRQLREALFARAWPDPDILARFTEGDAGPLKTLMEALERAAPQWAALKADIEAGLVTPEMDISGHVLDAMRLIGSARDLAAVEQARRAAMPKDVRTAYSVSDAIQELLDEVDLIEGAVSPLTASLVKKFWRDGRAASADDVAAFLSRYADDARKAGAGGGLFDAPTPRDVLQAIDRDGFADLPEDLGNVRGFARPGEDAARAEAVAGADHSGFDEGAVAESAAEADAAIRVDIEGGAEAPAATLPVPERAAIDAARAELGPDFADMEIDLPDGTTARVSDVMDDLDADEGLDAVIQACAITPNGAAQ